MKMKLRLALTSLAAAVLLCGCKFNSSGWPIIWFMHNGTPVPEQGQ